MPNQENSNTPHIIHPNEPHLVASHIVPAFADQHAPGELLVPEETPETPEEEKKIILPHEYEQKPDAVIFTEGDVPDDFRERTPTEKDPVMHFAKILKMTPAGLYDAIARSPEKVFQNLFLSVGFDNDKMKEDIKNNIEGFAFPNTRFKDSKELDTAMESIASFYTAFKKKLPTEACELFFKELYSLQKTLTIGDSDEPKFSLYPEPIRELVLKHGAEYILTPHVQELLCWQVNEIEEADAKRIIQSLKEHHHIVSDLGQLLIERFPKLSNECSDASELSSLSTEEILSEWKTSVKIAGNARETITEIPTNIGLEIEMKLGGAEQGRNVDTPFYQAVFLHCDDMLSGECHKDQGVTEIETDKGGQEWDKETVLRWTHLFKDIARHTDLISFATAHINVDGRPDLRDERNLFDFRKMEQHRFEYIDTPVIVEKSQTKDSQIFDATGLSDICQIVGGLYDFPEVKIDALLSKNVREEDRGTIRELIAVAEMPKTQKGRAGAFIDIAKDFKKETLIPQILRCAERGTLPMMDSELHQSEIAEQLKEVSPAELIEFAKAGGSENAQYILIEKISAITTAELIEFAKVGGSENNQYILSKKISAITTAELIEFAKVGGKEYVQYKLAKKISAITTAEIIEFAKVGGSENNQYILSEKISAITTAELIEYVKVGGDGNVQYKLAKKISAITMAELIEFAKVGGNWGAERVLSEKVVEITPAKLIEYAKVCGNSQALRVLAEKITEISLSEYNDFVDASGSESLQRILSKKIVS